MKTEDELQLFFDSQIKPKLKSLETWRIKVLIRAIITDILFAPPFLLAFFGLIAFMTGAAITGKMSLGSTLQMVIWLSSVSLIFFMPYCMLWRILRYRSTSAKKPDGEAISLNRKNELLYKKLVIGKLVEFISPDLKYEPQAAEVSGREVLKGEIFPHTIFYPEGYTAEDFIEGRIGNISVRFFEISGKDAIKPLAYSDSGHRTAIDLNGFPWETFSFHGMLGETDFNKSFNGHTLVCSGTGITRSQWMRASGRQRVRLEDPEFNRYFAVFSTDQITARYILSTALMKRITDYRKKVGRKIYLSFTENRLHVAVSHRKDQFEFNIYSSLYNFGRIKEFFTDLTIITDIIDALNLNTNIWLKEGLKAKGMFEVDPDYKPKSEWIYKFLLYAFGCLGLHFLYIGYRGKAFVYFSITMAVCYFLFFALDQLISRAVILFVFGLLWYTYIWHKGHHITHDRRGIRFD